MASTTYNDHSSAYAGDTETRRERSVGEHVFVWLAWALAAAFWGMTMTTMVGIFNALGHPASDAAGGADFGGVAWLIIDVIGGMVILGAVLAYASLQYAKRNRRLDPVGEAATHELYDQVERQGGEDLTTRSPERERLDRDLR